MKTLSPGVLGVTACLVVISALSGGCLGYRVGGHLPPGIRSVFVPTVENASEQPQLETLATAAIIEQFQLDGRLSVAADMQSADARLDVRITASEIRPLRYDRDEVVTATEYRLTLSAEATLIRLNDNSRILDRQPVQGWVEFDTDRNLPEARKAASPAATRELGRQIVRTIVEQW